MEVELKLKLNLNQLSLLEEVLQEAASGDFEVARVHSRLLLSILKLDTLVFQAYRDINANLTVDKSQDPS